MSSLPPLSPQSPTPKNEVEFAQAPSKSRLKLLGIGTIVLCIILGGGAWILTRTTPQSAPPAVVGTLQLDTTPAPPQLPPLDELQAPPMTQLVLQLASSKDATSPQTLERNTPTTASILLQSSNADQVVDGVELVIRFDPESIGAVTLKPSAVFSTVVRNSVSQETGTISFVAIRQPNETLTTTEQIAIGTISFTPKKTGTATLSFDTTATQVAGNGGENILEKTYDLSFTSN